MAAATAEINNKISMKIWTSLQMTIVHYLVAKIIVAAGTIAEVKMKKMARRELCVKITRWTQPSFLLSVNSNSSSSKIRHKWPLTF